MKIGIAITAYHRPDVLESSLKEWAKYLPDGAEFVVVQDVEGVAKAKNLCLKLLEEKGVTNYFLFDEDCTPKVKGWELPYLNSNEEHLLYQFKLPNKPASDMRVLYQDDKLISYSHTRGAMIYVTKKVLETVGGFDEEYGTFFEHPDYTNRIHNAGLTTHRAADVVGSEKLFYCLDQDGSIESSIPDTVRKANWTRNWRLYQKNKRSKEYKEYRSES